MCSWLPPYVLLRCCAPLEEEEEEEEEEEAGGNPNALVQRVVVGQVPLPGPSLSRFSNAFAVSTWME